MIAEASLHSGLIANPPIPAEIFEDRISIYCILDAKNQIFEIDTGPFASEYSISVFVKVNKDSFVGNQVNTKSILTLIGDDRILFSIA